MRIEMRLKTLGKKCSSLLSREPMFEKLAQEETKSAQILLKFT
jgi:hypothetical protein